MPNQEWLKERISELSGELSSGESVELSWCLGELAKQEEEESLIKAILLIIRYIKGG